MARAGNVVEAEGEELGQGEEREMRLAEKGDMAVSYRYLL